MNSLPLCASASAAVFRQRAMRLQGICQAVLSIWGSRIEYFVVLHWCQRNTRQMRTVDCGSFPDSGAPPFFLNAKKRPGPSSCKATREESSTPSLSEQLQERLYLLPSNNTLVLVRPDEHKARFEKDEHSFFERK